MEKIAKDEITHMTGGELQEDDSRLYAVDAEDARKISLPEIEKQDIVINVDPRNVRSIRIVFHHEDV